jgi:AraC family transcriptional regulator, transcriptional activator of pobA
MIETAKIPIQKTLNYNFERVPVEYIKWGANPDHFKIDMPHRHEFDELLVFIIGGGTHEIDFIEHNIRDYSVHFITAKTVHFLKKDKHSDGFTIAFNKEFLLNHPNHPVKSPLYNEAAIFNLTKEEFDTLLSIISHINNQILNVESYYVEKCFGSSIELLLNQLMSYTKDQANSVIQTNEIVNSFVQLIEQHVSEHRSVEFYSGKLNVSPKYLGNLTRRFLLKSAKNLINDMFLMSIKKEISNPQASLKILAYKLNTTESNICKFFKKHVGYTIDEYKSQINTKY